MALQSEKKKCGRNGHQVSSRAVKPIKPDPDDDLLDTYAAGNEQKARNEELPLADGFDKESAYKFLDQCVCDFGEQGFLTGKPQLATSSVLINVPEGGITQPFWEEVYRGVFIVRLNKCSLISPSQIDFVWRVALKYSLDRY